MQKNNIAKTGAHSAFHTQHLLTCVDFIAPKRRFALVLRRLRQNRCSKFMAYLTRKSNKRSLINLLVESKFRTEVGDTRL